VNNTEYLFPDLARRESWREEFLPIVSTVEANPPQIFQRTHILLVVILLLFAQVPKAGHILDTSASRGGGIGDASATSGGSIGDVSKNRRGPPCRSNSVDAHGAHTPELFEFCLPLPYFLSKFLFESVFLYIKLVGAFFIK
jgi:hypothetical protein